MIFCKLRKYYHLREMVDLFCNRLHNKGVRIKTEEKLNNEESKS